MDRKFRCYFEHGNAAYHIVRDNMSDFTDGFWIDINRDWVGKMMPLNLEYSTNTYWWIPAHAVLYVESFNYGN